MFDRPRTAARRELAARASAWPLTLGLFLEVIACSIALIGLMDGRNWWLALIGTAMLLLGVPMLLRGLGLPAWAASLIDVALFAGLIQLFYGITSTPSLFRDAMHAVQAQPVPAAPLPVLTFLFVLFGGVSAVLLDFVAVTLRLPALTAVVVAGVLVVPAVLQPAGLNLTALGAAAGAWLLVLWTGGVVRFGARGGGRLALGVGASAVVVALVVAGTAPGFSAVWRSPSSGAVSIGTSVNPLIDLSKNLREPVPVTVLRYTTTNPQPEYLQLTTLDTFNGTVWQHQPGRKAAIPHSGQLGWPQGLPQSGVPTKQYSTSISVQNVGSEWLPLPYPSVKLTGSSGDATTYEPLDHTVDATNGRIEGAHYSTSSLDVTAPLEQVDAIEEADAGAPLGTNIERDLYLPRSVPKIITQTAQRVVSAANATTPFDDAVALQDYFQSSLNGFSYSTKTPDAADGTSLAVVARFLEQKQGYCIHFATAMAVMARVLGIPSRIAIGYLPGELERANGTSFTYQVESSDLHAWPQLYFPGVGWLDFEPTVSRGVAPAYTIPTASTTDAGSSAAAAAPQSARPVTTPTAAPQAQAQTATGAADVTSSPGVPGLFGGLVLVAVVVAPLAARRIRRSSRLRRLREEGRPVRLAWAELRDTARDLGIAAPLAETPRAFAARIRDAMPTDAGFQHDLDTMLELLEYAEYGPRTNERHYELAELTEQVSRALARTMPLGARLRATFIPVSLFEARSPAAPGSARTLS